jgi:hypothetical protein
MERFIVFEEADYEGAKLPSKAKSFATLEEAREYARSPEAARWADLFEIFDCDERRVVETLTR